MSILSLTKKTTKKAVPIATPGPVAVPTDGQFDLIGSVTGKLLAEVEKATGLTPTITQLAAELVTRVRAIDYAGDVSVSKLNDQKNSLVYSATALAALVCGEQTTTTTVNGREYQLQVPLMDTPGGRVVAAGHVRAFASRAAEARDVFARWRTKGEQRRQAQLTSLRRLAADPVSRGLMDAVIGQHDADKVAPISDDVLAFQIRTCLRNVARKRDLELPGDDGLLIAMSREVVEGEGAR